MNVVSGGIARSIVPVAVMAVTCLFLLPGSAGTSAASRAANVSIKVPDAELQDQDGRRLRLKTDIFGDRLVAVTFTFTTCTTICPVLDTIFISVQDKISNRLGKDIVLITLSVDPVNDTPARLKEHAMRLRAKNGWVFLTGNKQDMDRVLLGMDVYTSDIRKHPPAVLVGDPGRGAWRRLNGFPSPDRIVNVLKELENDRT